MAITLKVNKQPRTIDVPGDTPLLWVLRDVLGLAGRDRARSKSMVCTKQGVGVAGAAFVPSLGLVFGDLAGAHIGTNRNNREMRAVYPSGRSPSQWSPTNSLRCADWKAGNEYQNHVVV